MVSVNPSIVENLMSTDRQKVNELVTRLFVKQKQGFLNRTLTLSSVYGNLLDPSKCIQNDNNFGDTIVEMSDKTHYLRKKFKTDFDITISDNSSSNQKLPLSCSLTGKPENQRYIGSDEYINYMLINLYLNEKKHPNIQQLLWSGVCDNIGQIHLQNINNLYSYITVSSIHSIYKNYYGNPNGTGNLIESTFLSDNLIKPIFNILGDLYNKYKFIHGELYIGNIGIFNNNFQLSNFGKSGLTISENNNRLYCKKTSTDLIFKASPFKPDIGVVMGIPYYRIDSINTDILLGYIRHTGQVFYQSFDKYTYLVSLYCIPNIFYTILNTPQLKYPLWENLWFIDDISNVFIKIYNIVNRKDPQNHTFLDVLNVIRGVKLKCDLSFDTLFP